MISNAPKGEIRETPGTGSLHGSANMQQENSGVRGSVSAVFPGPEDSRLTSEGLRMCRAGRQRLPVPAQADLLEQQLQGLAGHRRDGPMDQPVCCRWPAYPRGAKDTIPEGT